MTTFMLALLVAAIQCYVGLYLLYLWVPALAAVVGARFQPKVSIPIRRERNFAILIPAHNEEAVIASLLQSLARQNYPADRRRVYVVADECSDATPTIVRWSGVATCFERTNRSVAIKGAALAWLWEQIKKTDSTADCVLVLDADNLVPPEFLSEMNRVFDAGYRVVQSARRAKNMEDTWVTRLDAISEALWNRLDQAGRMRLGLSATIAGSGMAFEREVFEQLIGDGPPHMSEDIEWQARLMLAGVRVGYAERANVYDEKLERASQLRQQRKRWTAGTVVASQYYSWPLLKAGIKTRSVEKFVACFAVTKPPRSLLLIGIGLLALTSFLFPGAPGLLPASFHVAALASLIAYLLLGMVLDHTRPRSYVALVQAPVFVLLILLVTVIGMLRARKQKWTPTPHRRNLTIDQLHSN